MIPAAQKEKTMVLEDRSIATHPKRQGGKRLMRALMLFAILLVMALAYLSQSGEIKKYTDAILALWDKVTSYLGPFLFK